LCRGAVRRAPACPAANAGLIWRICKGTLWRVPPFAARDLANAEETIINKKEPRTMPPPSAFDEHKDELERYEQMFGRERGRLAVSLDRLTNALVLVGQHGVYCTSQRNPMVPAMDLRMVVQELVHAKELTQSVMEELRKLKESPGA
jgi:hypothetical protein